MGISQLIVTVVLLQAPAPATQVAPMPATISAAQQREGLRIAIEALKKQIAELSATAGREVVLPDLASPTSLDQQNTVIRLADAIDGNSLLARSYLALAAAELKFVTLPCCINSFPPGERKKILYHVEAIRYAIDPNALEKDDLRVLRGVEAGISQAIREESTPLQSAPTIVYAARSRRHGARTVMRFARCQ